MSSDPTLISFLFIFFVTNANPDLLALNRFLPFRPKTICFPFFYFAFSLFSRDPISERFLVFFCANPLKYYHTE
jgi:hypothetical protein